MKGNIGRAGHLGHMSQDIDGPPSITNMPGAIDRMIENDSVSDRSRGLYSSTRDLVQTFEANDTEATKIWRRAMKALGCAIGSYINILDPEVVVLTGGIATAGDSLMNPLNKVLDEVEWRPGSHKVPVIFGKLGTWSSAVGAAYTAINFESI